MNFAMSVPSSATLRYDEMCRAIALAYEVDEVKDIRDKALAVEVYARQARNTEAETKACEIRLRAERRCGQLLREREMAKGAKGNPGGQGAAVVRSQGETAQTLTEIGISKTQSSRWQKLAAIPDREFEAGLARPEHPTTTGLIATRKEPKPPTPAIPLDDRALWLWGRMLDFERMGLLTTDPSDLMAAMLPHMRETTRTYAPRVSAWLRRVKS